MDLIHGVNQGLRAHHLYKRDVDYVVKDGQVVIVDEFTGRMMPGRRWSDGLHQAVEAKEGVKIERENQTLATITFQNFFRMYKKLAGMTGTAETEAAEFEQIYKLDVVVIPTNRDMVRADRPDLVYRSAAREVGRRGRGDRGLPQAQGQPVLVGTVSIEKSEMLSGHAQAQGHPARRAERQVPRARGGDRRAGRAARARSPSPPTWPAAAPTSSSAATPKGWRAPRPIRRPRPRRRTTRGAYEQLPATPARASAKRSSRRGGLHIIGTERHESRRIDNQLRGRAGRQGDPGSSRFFLSLEDDLMRIFGSERIQGLMGRLGMEEGEAIEHRMVSRAIERAQKQVEGRNFEIRKHLLEYDDVMNKQREAIYKLRRDIFDGTEGRDYVVGVSKDILETLVATHCPEKTEPAEWTLSELVKDVLAYFDIDLHARGLKLAEMTDREIAEEVWAMVEAKYLDKEQRLGPELLRMLERDVMLRYVDLAWKDHLLALDHLKEGIGLRGYGQRDPLQEYKKESYELFQALKERVEDTVIKTLFRHGAGLRTAARGGAPAPRARRAAAAPGLLRAPGSQPAIGGRDRLRTPARRPARRNDPARRRPRSRSGSRTRPAATTPAPAAPARSTRSATARRPAAPPRRRGLRHCAA